MVVMLGSILLEVAKLIFPDLFPKISIGSIADISKGGPMGDSDDDTTGAWVVFGVMVVVALIAGVVAYLFYIGTFHSAPE